MKDIVLKKHSHTVFSLNEGQRAGPESGPKGPIRARFGPESGPKGPIVNTVFFIHEILSIS